MNSRMSRNAQDQMLSQAIALQQRGRLDDAEQLYNAILARDSGNAPALHFLGLLFHQRGQHEQANLRMQQALTHRPNDPVFLDNFIHALITQGRLQDSLPLLQRLLDLNPHNAAAWHDLASVLKRLGGPEDAVDCWRRALAVDPGFQPAALGLGALLRDMSLREEAEAVYRAALERAAHDTELVCALADVQVELGRADAAVSILDGIPRQAAGRPEVHYSRGIAQITLGDFRNAEASFRSTITLDPDFYHAYVHLTSTAKIPVTDSIYAHLESIAHRPTAADDETQVNVHFSLGKMLQDAGEYDHAFEHFAAGNRACRRIRPYSHFHQAGQVSELKAQLDASFISRVRVKGNPTALPVFIVGMPRSGTTLTEQILARHRSVHAGGEMVLLHGMLRRQLGKQYRRSLAAGIASMHDDAIAGIAGGLEARLLELAGDAVRVTDKMPSNFMLLGWLHAMFPNARFVHCRREPLDTCVSCFTTLFNRGHEFSNDLEDLGRYYLLYLDMMSHWRGLLPADRLLELDYESLVSDPEPEVRRLLEFLGLPWAAECMNFGVTSKTVQTASVVQVRQPLYASSVGRWHHYESHLEPLRRVLGGAA